MSASLSAVGVENWVVTNSQAEAHILIPADSVRPLLSKASPLSERDIALLWGSSIHYTSGSEHTNNVHSKPQLTPSAKFQVAWLRTMSDVEVVIVPNWWWQPCDGVEVSGQRLVAFIASGGHLPSAELA